MTMITLAIDAGTSALKLMRVDQGLNILSVDRVPNSGLAINHWLDAIRQNLHSRGDADRISCIAITGQMHGLVTLEASGYGEVIPWNDQRGTALLPSLNTLLGPNISSRLGGPLASGFQSVSHAWLRANEPERWRGIERILLPKDALVHALTGQHVTDPSDAAGTGMLDIEHLDWAWDVVDAIGIPREWLPRIAPSGTDVGPVLTNVAERFGLGHHVRVVIAGGDAPVGAWGASVTRSGQALIMLSTGAQVILPSDRYTPDPAGRWYTWPASIPGGAMAARYLQVGTLLNAGNLTGWLRGILVNPDDVAPDPTRLIVLPHLIGERTPLRDPIARGAILGMTPETSAAELSRAVIEGIAYSLRHALDEMCEAGTWPEIIRLGGGGAHNATWQTVITNVLGIPTERITTADITAYGAAALGLGHPVPEAAGHRVHPDADLVDVYDVRYAIYRDALDATLPISHRLSTVDSPKP